LTEEVTNELDSWVKYKYRTRRACYQQDNEAESKKTVTEYITLSVKRADLVFAMYRDKQTPAPYSLYADLADSFAKTLDRMGNGKRDDNNGRYRQITLHSFRRFVKTTISYLFKKIEPYLTFLNIYQLERQGARYSIQDRRIRISKSNFYRTRQD
jgi:hypothetical protein